MPTIKSITVPKNFLELLSVILKDSGADTMQQQKCMARIIEIVEVEYEESPKEITDAGNSNSNG